MGLVFYRASFTVGVGSVAVTNHTQLGLSVFFLIKTVIKYSLKRCMVFAMHLYELGFQHYVLRVT